MAQAATYITFTYTGIYYRESKVSGFCLLKCEAKLTTIEDQSTIMSHLLKSFLERQQKSVFAKNIEDFI